MMIRRFTESQSMMTETAATLANALAAESARPFAVMLSGGQTPMRAYELLPVLRPRISPHVYVLFSDERHVPAASPESNYGRMLPFLKAAHLPEDRILHVKTDMELSKAADDYDQTLKAFLTKGGRIPLGFLGIGTDGHTASLFTAADLERGKNRYAIAVPRATKPDRISVTPSFLGRIDRIIFLVAGADKAAVIEQVLHDPMHVIAGRAVAGCMNVELWHCLPNLRC